MIHMDCTASRSSSAMFKLQVMATVQQDDATDSTIGCGVFKITYFDVLVFN